MKRNGKNSKESKDSVVSISGEILPESLVTSIREYKVTEFNTKTKEELLAMLVISDREEGSLGKVSN